MGPGDQGPTSPLSCVWGFLGIESRLSVFLYGISSVENGRMDIILIIQNGRMILMHE